MTSKQNVLMYGQGLRPNDGGQIAIECAQCGARLIEDIYELDSWTVGFGWADVVSHDVKVEHVCDPQPTDRCHVLLNVALGPAVIEEAVKALS